MISIQCQAQMHPACVQRDECACTVCNHQQVGSCGHHTPRLYGANEVCPACYKLELALAPKQTMCMGCFQFKPYCYRDPRSGDDRHLCNECHKDLGHRYQEEGVWVEPATSGTAS